MNTDKNLSSGSSAIHPAQRVENVTEYYFSRRLREVAEMNSRGLDVVSLGIGGPDRPPHPSVVEELCADASRPDSHSYQVSTGLPALRQAFASWYQRYYDVELNPASEILPLMGSKEGIIHVDMTFLNPGDGVLVPKPGYPTYTSAAKLIGAEVFSYDLTADNDWQPDFQALETLPLDRIKLMWVNYPHMPTGARAKMETFSRLIDFGRKHGIVIAHDNPYSFILPASKPLSILQVPGAKDVAIELNSLSKSHNMAGWRMAMLAANPQFIGWILKVKSNMDSGQFRPAMKAAVKALALDDTWYAELNKEYAERRGIAERILTELGCDFDSQQTGMFLWGRIPSSEVSGEALADKLLYEARVFIAPGFIFGSNGDRYIRLSLCATKENLQRALDRIIEFRGKSTN